MHFIGMMPQCHSKSLVRQHVAPHVEQGCQKGPTNVSCLTFLFPIAHLDKDIIATKIIPGHHFAQLSYPYNLGESHRFHPVITNDYHCCLPPVLMRCQSHTTEATMHSFKDLSVQSITYI